MHDGEGDHHIQNLALLGQLAGRIAHDFSNVLTAMEFNLEQAKSDDLTVGRQAISNLQLLVNRAAITTRQLLTFAQNRSPTSRPLAVNPEVGNTLEVLNRLLGDDIELRFVPAPGNPWMTADSGMVFQAILNLCFNARDAMPDGGVLTVEAQVLHHPGGREARCPEAAPGDYVCLRFTDTGLGIAPEHLDRVFEPLFTTKAAGKGTGLGLASVCSGARQHGGWVEVDSSLGRGTTFRLFLPQAAAPAP
jgi:signal transduction histidine kinase